MHRCKVLVPGGDDGLKPMTAPVGFQRQELGETVRLWVSVNSEWLDTLQKLALSADGIYKCIYEERGGSEDDSDIVVESAEIPMESVQRLCTEFADFLEIDPRHNFIIQNARTDDRFTLDEHNFIFCYGDLDRFEDKLKSMRLSEESISLPTPHVHQLHDTFDHIKIQFVEALKSIS